MIVIYLLHPVKHMQTVISIINIHSRGFNFLYSSPFVCILTTRIYFIQFQPKRTYTTYSTKISFYSWDIPTNFHTHLYYYFKSAHNFKDFACVQEMHSSLLSKRERKSHVIIFWIRSSITKSSSMVFHSLIPLSP